MFDKMIFKAKIDTADIDTIVLKNYLEQCTEGDEIYYKSTAMRISMVVSSRFGVIH